MSKAMVTSREKNSQRTELASVESRNPGARTSQKQFQEPWPYPSYLKKEEGHHLSDTRAVTSGM